MQRGRGTFCVNPRQMNRPRLEVNMCALGVFPVKAHNHERRERDINTERNQQRKEIWGKMLTRLVLNWRDVTVDNEQEHMSYCL